MINIKQKDLDAIISSVEPDQWQRSPFSDNMVRADFSRNVLFIVQFSRASKKNVLDRKTKTYKEISRPSQYIIDRVIMDPTKTSILKQRSDSVFVLTEIEEEILIEKLNLDWKFEDNAEVEFEEICTE